MGPGGSRFDGTVCARFVLIITSLALAADAAGAQTAGALFADTSDVQAMAASADDDGLDVRARVVRANLALLPPPEVPRHQAMQAPIALELNLFNDVRFLAYLTRTQRLADGAYSWSGQLAGIPESQIVLAVAGSALAGSINTGAASYQIRWAGDGLHEIRQIDSAALRAESEPVPVSAADLAAVHLPSSGALAADDGSTIDVLVVYTTAAKAGAGGESGIRALIALGMSESNEALAVSGLPTRLRLAASHEWNRAESGSAGTELHAVRTAPEIAARRDAAAADLVLLIANRFTDSCGAAYLLNTMSEAFAPYAYAAVDRGCVSPNYSFVHELGHLMGSDHAPEDGGRGGVLPYAVGFKDPAAAVRTVMALNCPTNCRRLLSFSTPRVALNGRPLGRDGQDNARALFEAARTVANFRRSGQPTTSGPAHPPSAPSQLTASVQGHEVFVQWAAPASGTPATYVLEAGSAPGLANLARVTLEGRTTALHATGVGAGVYYVRVRAANASGTSAPSGEIVVRVGF